MKPSHGAILGISTSTAMQPSLKRGSCFRDRPSQLEKDLVRRVVEEDPRFSECRNLFIEDLTSLLQMPRNGELGDMDGACGDAVIEPVSAGTLLKHKQTVHWPTEQHMPVDQGILKVKLEPLLRDLVRVCLENWDLEQTITRSKAASEHILKLEKQKIEAHRAYMQELSSLRDQMRGLERKSPVDCNVTIDDIYFYDPAQYFDESLRDTVKELVNYKVREQLATYDAKIRERPGSPPEKTLITTIQQKDEQITELKEMIQDMEFMAGQMTKSKEKWSSFEWRKFECDKKEREQGTKEQQPAASLHRSSSQLEATGLLCWKCQSMPWEDGGPVSEEGNSNADGGAGGATAAVAKVSAEGSAAECAAALTAPMPPMMRACMPEEAVVGSTAACLMPAQGERLKALRWLQVELAESLGSMGELLKATREAKNQDLGPRSGPGSVKDLEQRTRAEERRVRELRKRIEVEFGDVKAGPELVNTGVCTDPMETIVADSVAIATGIVPSTAPSSAPVAAAPRGGSAAAQSGGAACSGAGVGRSRSKALRGTGGTGPPRPSKRPTTRSAAPEPPCSDQQPAVPAFRRSATAPCGGQIESEEANGSPLLVEPPGWPFLCLAEASPTGQAEDEAAQQPSPSQRTDGGHQEEAEPGVLGMPEEALQLAVEMLEHHGRLTEAAVCHDDLKEEVAAIGLAAGKLHGRLSGIFATRTTGSDDKLNAMKQQLYELHDKHLQAEFAIAEMQLKLKEMTNRLKEAGLGEAADSIIEAVGLQEALSAVKDNDEAGVFARLYKDAQARISRIGLASPAPSRRASHLKGHGASSEFGAPSDSTFSDVSGICPQCLRPLKGATSGSGVDASSQAHEATLFNSSESPRLEQPQPVLAPSSLSWPGRGSMASAPARDSQVCDGLPPEEVRPRTESPAHQPQPATPYLGQRARVVTQKTATNWLNLPENTGGPSVHVAGATASSPARASPELKRRPRPGAVSAGACPPSQGPEASPENMPTSGPPPEGVLGPLFHPHLNSSQVKFIRNSCARSGAPAGTHVIAALPGSAAWVGPGGDSSGQLSGQRSAELRPLPPVLEIGERAGRALRVPGADASRPRTAGSTKGGAAVASLGSSASAPSLSPGFLALRIAGRGSEQELLPPMEWSAALGGSHAQGGLQRSQRGAGAGNAHNEDEFVYSTGSLVEFPGSSPLVKKGTIADSATKQMYVLPGSTAGTRLKLVVGNPSYL